MSSFYSDTIAKLIAEGAIDPAASTLVVAAGLYDRAVLLDLGFSDVTISNLDERMRGDEFAPFKWQFLDAENLDLEDESFDQVFVHMGLHHCGSPHRGLLEMFRVARRAVLVFENRDSLSMKFASRIGLAADYEFEAVADNDFQYGGWRNSAVPNRVYRWTERDVEKTLASWDPAHDVPVRYFYGLRLPQVRIDMMSNPLIRTLFRTCFLPIRLLSKLAPKQMNEFGIFIHKEARTLRSWMDPQTGQMSRAFWNKGHRDLRDSAEG